MREFRGRLAQMLWSCSIPRNAGLSVSAARGVGTCGSARGFGDPILALDRLRGIEQFAELSLQKLAARISRERLGLEPDIPG